MTRFSAWQLRMVAASGAVYGVVSLCFMPRVFPYAFSASDAAFLPVVAALTREYGFDIANRTNGQSSFTSLLVDFAVRELPFRWGLWQAWPLIGSLLAVAVTSWVVTRLTNRTVGLVTAVVLGGQNIFVLSMTMAQNNHSVTLISIAVLGATLAAAFAGWFDRRRLLWVAVPLGVVLGLNVGSDPMLAAAGFVPFVVVAGALWWRTRDEHHRRAVGVVAVVTASAFVTAIVTVLAIRALGVHFSANAVVSPLAPRLFARRLADNLFALRFVILVPPAMAAAWIAARRRAQPSTALDAFVWFWIATMGAIVASFLATGAETSAATRYVFIPLFVSGATALPVIASSLPWSRWLCSAAATASVLFAALSVIVGGQPELQGQLLQYRYRIADALAARHVRVGYASYWSASALTFSTKSRVEVFPVEHCGERLCQFPTNSLDAWFAPRANTPTFLLIDPTQVAYRLTHAPASLGRPRETVTVGPFEIYIYDYDLATRIVSRDDPARSPAG